LGIIIDADHINLDLYRSTRHTTTTEIARRAGTENARKASAHETNKAFDRYCQFQNDTAFQMAKVIKRPNKQHYNTLDSNHLLFNKANN